jgi:hypothetical protein
MTNSKQFSDVWEALEDPTPAVAHTADLYHWSTNYDAGKGPFTLFLDLIGWSDEHIGQNLYDLAFSVGLGYMELDKLGKALVEYSEAPSIVMEYVVLLLELESNG